MTLKSDELHRLARTYMVRPAQNKDKAGRRQETQLSLTNRATRLEASQGHQTWYHSIC